MRLSLQPHPGSRAPSLRIAAEAERPVGGRLGLRFFVSGAIDAVRWPEPRAPARADGLWRRTCFEAFARAPGEAGYFELNFAPSGEWAAYRFSDYRAGMATVDEIASPDTASGLTDGGYAFQAAIDLEPAMGLLAGLAWQVGLAAVIEARDGGRSYWSVTHAPGEPDFHHPDCFALELPPPERG